MERSSAAINYPLTIKSPAMRDKKKSTKLTKCPECLRTTFRDDRCERCGHSEKGGRRFIL